MNDHKKWVSETFDLSAAEYGKKSSSFFSHFGSRLVEQVEISKGGQILDVATGRGAVLFPLVDAVGPKGKVVGIDISREMLKETSQELINRSIQTAELNWMDAEQLSFPDQSFDFVFCGFALFFFPSMLKALSEFKRVLKPGGKLVVSTWGEDTELELFMNDEIHQISKVKSLTATPLWSGEELRTALEKASFQNIQISEETHTFFHKTAEEWWNSLWTHGTRAKFEQLNPTQIASLREKALQKARSLDQRQGIPESLQVFYGVAEKT